MPKFAANLSMLFTELPFLDRFAAAARAGFRGVEFLFPYDHKANQIARRLADNDLELVLFNLPPGDWAAGERGIACLAERGGEFRQGLETARAYAAALSCRQVHCMAGVLPPGADSGRARETYSANLRRAAEAFAPDGVRVLIEPINTRDMPGYFLSSTADAIAFIDEIAMPNLALQYDCYHMHIMEGGLATTLARLKPRIAHVQIADAPGRHEPGSGGIGYDEIFETLDKIGYDGWVGCEYRPLAGTDQSLAWFRNLAARGKIENPA